MEFHFLPQDQELIDDWFEHINAKGGTLNLYQFAITKYLKFHDLSLTELLKEAEDDMVKGVTPRYRRIKSRIIDFRNSLEGNSDNTQHGYVSAVRSFYKSMDVELPNNKRYEKTSILVENKFRGIERSEIKRILKYANVRDKAIVLFISSSGTAANELAKLTKEDFSNGFDRETGICTFYIRRKKTGSDYHTYCTPEASAAIQEYLNTREDDLPWLFVGMIKETKETVQLTTNAVGGIFRRLAIRTGNEGEFGFYNKIRGHNFRKFFKTALTEAESPRWAVEYMMGHKEELDDRYLSTTGIKMRNAFYLPYVNSLMIDTAEVIIQPKEELNALRELQAEMKLMREKEQQKDLAISELMKITLELKNEIDTEKIDQQILSEIDNDKSVDEINAIMNKFEKGNGEYMDRTGEIVTLEDAKKEAEMSRKMSPKKLINPIPKRI